MKILTGLLFTSVMAFAVDMTNQTTQLDTARKHSWDGQLSQASFLFENYIKQQPNDKDGLIAYIKNEIWKGDYAHAKNLLHLYITQFGNDYAAQEANIELNTRAEWPDAASKLIKPLLVSDPNNYNLNYFETLRLHFNHQPTEALEQFKTVQKLQPDSKDTYDLNKTIFTPLRSFVSGSGFIFHDSDEISNTLLGANGKYFLSPTTALTAEVQNNHLQSKVSSTYKNIDGSSDSDVFHTGIGISQRISPLLGYDLVVGQAKSDNDSMPYVKASVDLDLSDEITLYLDGSYDYYMISPRSTSLGIEQTHTAATLDYRPNLEYTIVAQAEYDWYTNDNTRWGLLLAPRRAFVRNEYINLDLGVKGWWFGYDKTILNDGYYNPSLFQSYMATFYSTLKFTSEHELSLMGGAGYVKDNTMSGYRRGYNIDALLTLGIFKEWMFQGKAGYMNNLRQTSGSYNAHYFGITLTKRF